MRSPLREIALLLVQRLRLPQLFRYALRLTRSYA